MHDAAGDEIALPQQPRFGLARQFGLHARHGHRHRPPAVDGQQIVDAHADQEQRKGLLRMGLLTAGDDRHATIMAHSGATVT